MTQRYFIQLSYDGSAFSGWQIQPDVKSVQETIELALTRLNSNVPVPVTGCGRTDAGVHAKNYIAHFDFQHLVNEQQFCYKLNKMLPADITVHTLFPVSTNAHARFDATRRTYHYFIHQQKDPFLVKYSWHFPQRLNLEKMNEAAKSLLGKQDFTSFSKLHTDVKTNICEVYHASWTTLPNGQLRFEIQANRFLRNMVRAVVGTLLEVGLEKEPATFVRKTIQEKDRNAAGVSVPAHGLFLTDIQYP